MLGLLCVATFLRVHFQSKTSSKNCLWFFDKNLPFLFPQKRGSKRGSEKKVVTFKEPSLAPDLSSHTLVNHADPESDKLQGLVVDTMPDSDVEFEVKVITVSRCSVLPHVVMNSEYVLKKKRPDSFCAGGGVG